MRKVRDVQNWVWDLPRASEDCQTRPEKQEISKSPISKVPPELARHEAAQQKVTRDMKRKREGEDQG